MLNVGKMRNQVPLMSNKDIEALLKKKAKGTVTFLANKAKEALQYSTNVNFYNKTFVSSKRHYYKRSGGLYKSIVARKTETNEDEYFAVAEYDIEYLRANAEPPTFVKTKRGKNKLAVFGRYMDIYGDFVGDDMITDGWLENGTNPPIVGRKGSGMVESAVDIMNDFMASNGIEAEIMSELGGVTVVIKR